MECGCITLKPKDTTQNQSEPKNQSDVKRQSGAKREPKTKDQPENLNLVDTKNLSENRGARDDLQHNLESELKSECDIISEPEPEHSAQKTISRHVPASVRRIVMKRAENKCEYQSENGKRCNSDYQTEIEHVIPYSKGGLHRSDNLKCFCHQHNAYSASQLEIGFENWMS